MSEIPTIDVWNTRLAPGLWTDSNTSDSTTAEPGDCGCCIMPKCCPPQLECQSGVAYVSFEGHLIFGESWDSADGPEWERTRYLRLVTGVEGDDQVTNDTYMDYDADPPTEVTYARETVTASHYNRVVSEFSQAFSASMNDRCLVSSAEFTETCEIGGVRSTSFKAVVHDGGAYYVYESHLEDRVYSSAEGDETPAHISWQVEADAWEALYTDQAGFDAAHAAWVSATATYDAWTTARDAWVNEDPDNRNPEDYPEPEPPAPGDEPLALSPEPTKFFGPCDIKCVTTDTYWTWNYTTHAREFDSTNTYTDYGDSTFLGPSHFVTTYETPVTYDEFLVLAGAWVEANRDEFFTSMEASASDACVPDTDCYAENAEGTGSLTSRFFRYRWKLNKCCGLYSGLAWLEVFYQKAFLDWLAEALVDSTPPEAPVIPVTTNKAWEWEGLTRNPDCDNSDSADSVIGPNDPGFDPFDDETRWSPWSLTVSVPTGEFGRVHLRNLYMSCYRSIYGTKPDFIPLYGTYDPSDLDGIP